MKLVDIKLCTELGAVYNFPDMDAEEAERLVKSLELHTDSPQLTMSNVSRACLVIPTRIIVLVFVGDEMRWRR